MCQASFQGLEMQEQNKAFFSKVLYFNKGRQNGIIFQVLLMLYKDELRIINISVNKQLYFLHEAGTLTISGNLGLYLCFLFID